MSRRSERLRWTRSRSVRLLALAACTAALSALATVPSSAIDRAATADPCSPIPGVECILGVAYEDDGNPAHTLDAYFPPNLTDRASVVIIHGGRWSLNTSRTFAPEAVYLAQNGFAVFSINFTEAEPGQPSWPQVRSDVETATAWVMSHADEYHGDGTRVGVLGGSSGAHLAALVYTAGPEDGVRPLATVSWSGMMDLKLTYKRGNGAAKNGLIEFLGCKPSGCPQTYTDASPLSHVTGDDGSMLMFHSKDERVPIAGTREMNRALQAAGVPHTLVVLKHSTEHARQYECFLAALDGQTLPVIDDSIRWLGTQLGQPTEPTGTYCPAPPR